MGLNVAVWGTGNVGQPAIRSVLGNDALTLAGVIVANPDKVGRDAAELAGVDTATGVLATDDRTAVLDAVDAVAYCASGDFRPAEALDDIERCLRAGTDVVSTSVYPLLHPASAPPDLHHRLTEACRAGDSSCFVSGIDPGWAFDILPLLVSGTANRIEQVRVLELFNYAHYDQPAAVRELCGFGGSMDATPPMLLPTIPTSVWGGVLRNLADGLGLTLDRITEHVERLPLEETIEVDGMGTFDAGSQGAFRFEVRGHVGDHVPVVVEHITRITAEAAPDWPRPPAEPGCHRVQIVGDPNIEVTVTADRGDGDHAAGGNATAAGRIVNAIPAVRNAAPGLLGPADIAAVTGRGLFDLG